MTPKLPFSVRVLGSRVQVRAVKKLTHPDGEQELLGQCEMDAHKISVRLVGPDVDLATQQETLLHEIIHAIVAEGSLKFMFDGDQQEVVVGVLSSHLMAFMRENRRAMAYLLGRYWL